MEKVPFSVSARAARLIGRENVATSKGAVTELVKNSYDADADACAVLFLPRWPELPTYVTTDELGILGRYLDAIETYFEADDGRWHLRDELSVGERVELERACERVLDLWIVDNGHGMSPDVIRNRWMVIGTDAKEIEGRSARGRVVTGAKGIGRFALDRLGRESELFSSVPKSDLIVHWLVDWSEFEGAGKVVSDVEAVLETERRPLSEVYAAAGLAQKLPSRRPRHGQGAEAIDFNGGTAIRIGLLHDNWDDRDSIKLRETLESLLPPSDRRDFDIFVYDYRVPEAAGFITNLAPDQFDYRMSAVVEASGDVAIRLDRQEIDATRIRASVFDAEAMNRPGFRKEDFDAGSRTYKIGLRELLRLRKDEDLDPYLAVGAFSFTLYFFKLQNPSSDVLKRFPQKNFDVMKRRNWLKNSGGIRLYRDNFRVRPYGEPDTQAYDWLLLGERVARNPAPASRISWNVPPNQLAGTINISKEDNPLLDDQSNREGIRNERVFAHFRRIVLALIREFEYDRAYILGQFNTAYERDNPPPADVAHALDIVKQFRRDTGTAEGNAPTAPTSPAIGAGTRTPSPPPVTTEDFEDVGQALETTVQENEALRDDIQVMRGMATLGTVLVSFTHELKQLKADMESRSERLAASIQRVVDKDRLAKVPELASPFSVLDRVRRQDEKVSRWVDFALSAVSPAKRRRRSVDIGDYLAGVKSYWKDFLDDRSVDLEVDADDAVGASLLAHEIDLDSIFYNLINNSVEAFVKPSAASSRVIDIRAISSEPEWLDIEYSDNGPGLPDQFNVPDDIFIYGVSSKKDEDFGEPSGTGIGMWLLRNVVDDYNGKIDLRSKLGEAGFSINIRLPVSKGETADG